MFRWVRLKAAIGWVCIVFENVESQLQTPVLKSEGKSSSEAGDCSEVRRILRSLLLKSVGYIGLQSRTDRWPGKQVASAKQSGNIFPKK